MVKKIIMFLLAGIFLLQLTACGTLFHAERKNRKPSTQVDPVVLVLDCCGFLFGIIPGVVAIVLDYNNKTLYYSTSELKSASLEQMDRSRMIAVKMDNMDRNTVERVLSERLGREVHLNEMRLVAAN